MSGALLSMALLNAFSETEGLTDLFLKACVQGELRLRPGEGEALSRGDVSASIRNSFFSDKFARYYKIYKPAPAYLVVAHYSQPTREGWLSRCTLLAPVNLPVAYTKIHKQMTGETLKLPLRVPNYYELSVPSKRFKVFVSKHIGGEGRLQSIVFDAHTAAAMMRNQKTFIRATLKISPWGIE